MILKIANKPYELATKEEVMEEVKKEMEEVKKEIFDNLYPVGSVYISLSKTFNPNNIFNGKWEQIKSGIFLEATEDINQVGQEIEPGLPGPQKVLNKIYRGNIYGTAGGIDFVADTNKNTTRGDGSANTTFAAGSVATTSYYFDDNYAIYGKSDTCQPHSIRCFMWKRIS